MSTPLAPATCFARPMAVLSAAAALLACALGAAEVQAQEDRPPSARTQKSSRVRESPPRAAEEPQQDRNRIRVDVNLVSVLVSVLDEHNRPAPDLSVEAFQIFDEDNPQTITVFEKETEQPLDLLLMVDASLSAQLGMPAQREAASRFIQQVLRKGDRLAVYAFDEDVTQLAAFSDNVARLEEAVRRIPLGAGTSIYDAVYLGSQVLARQGSDRRRVIVLVTDGGETTSRADFDAARREAVRSGILLYSVVVRAVKSEGGRNTAGEHALETITDTTGGAVFYPDGAAELDAIFERINRELRTQYRLGYYPKPRGPADTYRRIEVTVTPLKQAAASASGASVSPGPAYSVRHRKSYYTGKP